MKTLLCIGCSNGRWFEPVLGELLPSWHIVDLSSPGAGAEYITARLMEYITLQGTPDRVYLQYSGLWRKDIARDANQPWPHHPYQRSTVWHSWLHSGGIFGSWVHDKTLRHEFERSHQLLPGHNRNALTVRSLSFIQSATTSLAHLGIEHRWSTYYDYCLPPNTQIRDSDGFITKWPKWLDQTHRITCDPFTVAQRMSQHPKDLIHWSRAVFEQWCLGPGQWLLRD